MEDRLKLINYYTVTSGAYPTLDKTATDEKLIEYGEIAVKCAADDEGLVILNTKNNLITIRPIEVLTTTGESTTAVMSQKAITDELTSIRNNFQKKIVIVSPSETTKGIEPNKYYKWGTVTSLNITLNTPTDDTILNEYVFEFTSGTTATSLNLPNTIKWLKGVKPTIETNTTYQISIVNNLAIACYFR